MQLGFRCLKLDWKLFICHLIWHLSKWQFPNYVIKQTKNVLYITHLRVSNLLFDRCGAWLICFPYYFVPFMLYQTMTLKQSIPPLSLVLIFLCGKTVWYLLSVSPPIRWHEAIEVLVFNRTGWAKRSCITGFTRMVTLRRSPVRNTTCLLLIY